jgi:hypothetical protein
VDTSSGQLPQPGSATTPPATPPAAPVQTTPLGLTLDRPDTFPGGSIRVSGAGCAPGSLVDLRAGDTPLGSTTAAADGTFSSSVVVPVRLSTGRLTLVATCGDRQATSALDLVLTTSSGSSSGASAATAAAAAAFFVLLGLLLTQGRGTPEARPVPTR